MNIPIPLRFDGPLALSNDIDQPLRRIDPWADLCLPAAVSFMFKD